MKTKKAKEEKQLTVMDSRYRLGVSIKTNLKEPFRTILSNHIAGVTICN